MTITEAAAAIGRRVAYRRPPALEALTGEQRRNDYYARPAEEGVITSTGKYVAYVRYGDDDTPRATNPGDLTLIAGES